MKSLGEKIKSREIYGANFFPIAMIAIWDVSKHFRNILSSAERLRTIFRDQWIR